jgi:mono/diheme cytochrome c family protein
MITLGAVLTLAGAMWLLLFQTTAAQIERGGPAPTQMPDAGSPSTPVPGATPTIDRLLAPPTVPVPNQADEGAQLFWLHCQPCHGDQGQGLTDEWRAQYPPEDQYCWASGCHGRAPYDPAFQLPTSVPAVIGEGTLGKFQTLDGVYRYISTAMPYFYPGDLTEEEYLAILAHIARGNGYWDGAPLTTDTLINYPVQPQPLAVAQATPVPTPTPAAPAAPGLRPGTTGLLALGAAVVFVGVLAGGFLWLRHSR